MAKYKSITEMAEEIRDEALDNIEYSGITLRELCDKLKSSEYAPVVRGEWIQKHHITSFSNMTLTGTFPTCNLCGYAWLGVAKNTNYCPNCGAKMEDNR